MFTWRRVGQTVPDLQNSGYFRLLIKVTVGGLVAACVSYLLVRLSIVNQPAISAPRLGLAIASFAASFILVYFALAKLFRISEVWALLDLVRRK
jgi:hypothetical protein